MKTVVVFSFAECLVWIFKRKTRSGLFHVKRFHFTTDWMAFSLGTTGGGLYMNYSFTCCCCYGATTGLNPESPTSCDSRPQTHARDELLLRGPRGRQNQQRYPFSSSSARFFYLLSALFFYSSAWNASRDCWCSVNRTLFIIICSLNEFFTGNERCHCKKCNTGSLRHKKVVMLRHLRGKINAIFKLASCVLKTQIQFFTAVKKFNCRGNNCIFTATQIFLITLDINFTGHICWLLRWWSTTVWTRAVSPADEVISIWGTLKTPRKEMKSKFVFMRANQCMPVCRSWPLLGNSWWGWRGPQWSETKYIGKWAPARVARVRRGRGKGGNGRWWRDSRWPRSVAQITPVSGCRDHRCRPLSCITSAPVPTSASTHPLATLAHLSSLVVNVP